MINGGGLVNRAVIFLLIELYIICVRYLNKLRGLRKCMDTLAFKACIIVLTDTYRDEDLPIGRNFRQSLAPILKGPPNESITPLKLWYVTKQWFSDLELH